MRKLVALFGAMAVVLTMSLPVAAAPPDRFDAPFFLIFPDTDNELVVFWNMTRDDYCAWEASDFDGEPPVDQLVSVQENTTGPGAIIQKWKATAHFELWTLNEDAPLTGPCEDTDDSTAPWAVGSGTASSHDNDLDHGASVEMGLRRTNTFGNQGRASVEDVNGDAWRYDWNVQYHIDKHDEFRVIFEKSRLTSAH